MPSCTGTEFEVIDHYLRIKGWIDEDDSYTDVPDQKTDSEEDTRAIACDHKLPQFSSSFLGGTDQDTSPSILTMEAGGGAPWDLNPLGTEPLPPSNFLLPTSTTPTHTPLYPSSKTFVAGYAGSGCTVIEATSNTSSSPPFAEDPLTGTDIYDLDGHSFYRDTRGGSVGGYDQDDGGHKHALLYSDCSKSGSNRGSTGTLSPYGTIPEVAIKTERPSMHEFAQDGCGMDRPLEDREDLTTFMIKSLREDIVKDCKQLNISLNPEKWTPEDTVKWVTNVLRREQATGAGGGSMQGSSCSQPSLPPLHEFHVPGDTLCRMTLTDFQRLSPFYGAMLHQRLDIWRMAMEFTSEQPMQMVPQWYPPHPHPHNQPHPEQPHYHSLTTISQFGSNSNIATETGAPNSLALADYNNHSHHHHQHHYGGTTTASAPHYNPLCISPAPSTDSNCSSLSSSSLSLGGRGGAEGSHHSSAGLYGMATSQGIRLDDEVFESATAAAASRRKTPQLAMNPHHSHHIHNRPTQVPARPLPNGTSTTTTPPTTTTTTTRVPRAGKQTIHLWQFLRELLDNADSYRDCIKWTDRARGIFKIEDSCAVARLWGRRKNRPAMNYDKLSRSVRQYYKKGIIKKTEHSKRLVYQFCQPYL